MARDTNFDEIRAVILNHWAEIETLGKKNSYVFGSGQDAKLITVCVKGRWRNSSRRINGKYLSLAYDGKQETSLCNDMPDKIRAVIGKTMAESDFDSLEFRREELAGKDLPRVRTFSVEVDGVIHATRVIEIRARSEEEALKLAKQDGRLTSLYYWQAKAISVEGTKIQSKT